MKDSAITIGTLVRPCFRGMRLKCSRKSLTFRTEFTMRASHFYSGLMKRLSFTCIPRCSPVVKAHQREVGSARNWAVIVGAKKIKSGKRLSAALYIIDPFERWPRHRRGVHPALANLFRLSIAHLFFFFPFIPQFLMVFMCKTRPLSLMSTRCLLFT